MGWQKVANLLNCGVNGDQCQKKWLKLIEKYKAIITPKTGMGLEDENHEAHTWPYFHSINEYMSDRHTITPLELIDSISGIQEHPVTLAPEGTPARARAPAPIPAILPAVRPATASAPAPTPAILPATRPETASEPTPSVSGLQQSRCSGGKRPAAASDSEEEDDLPTPGIVIRNKKRAAVVAAERAASKIIAQMSLQVNRSLDEQAKARLSEKAMLEMLQKFFGHK